MTRLIVPGNGVWVISLCDLFFFLTRNGKNASGEGGSDWEGRGRKTCICYVYYERIKKSKQDNGQGAREIQQAIISVQQGDLPDELFSDSKPHLENP